MSFAQSILGMLARTESSPDTVPPGHWKREEDQYLTQIGAMHYIKKDPTAHLGYLMQQSADGSGLVLSGSSPPGYYGRFIYPDDPGSLGLVEASVSYSPTEYGETLSHELGHAGQYYSVGRAPLDGEWEETRQRFVDYVMYPSTSNTHRQAKDWLTTNGLLPAKSASR